MGCQGGEKFVASVGKLQRSGHGNYRNVEYMKLVVRTSILDKKKFDGWQCYCYKCTILQVH